MVDNFENSLKNKWDELQSKEKFQPLYPSEHVVRFMFGSFSLDLAVRSRLKILDIGCGAGSNTLLFAKEGFETYATDISDSGLEVAKRRLKESNLSAVLKNAGMESQPFPDNFFDGAVSFGVFYYNDGKGYQRAVDELHRILKKGGKAMVFSRTKDDYRFGKGKKIGENNFVLDIEDTNEKDMPNYFLDRQDIDKIFSKFSDVIVEKTETTFCNLSKKNSDWIIKVKK